MDYGIRTIGQLAKTDINYLERIFGERSALQLHLSSNGIDDSEVMTEVPEAKSYSAERTFSKDLTSPSDVDRALFKVACIVAHRIRKDSFKASCVSIFVKRTDFTTSQKQSTLTQPTDITALILNEARRLLPEIWDGETPLRQVGLGVSRLTHDTAEQMSLFEDPRLEYYRNWDKEYDRKKLDKEDPRTLAYESLSKHSADH